MDCSVTGNSIRTRCSTKTSKNITGFEINQMSIWHKLSSIKFWDTKNYVCLSATLLPRQQFKSCVSSGSLRIYLRHYFHRLQKNCCLISGLNFASTYVRSVTLCQQWHIMSAVAHYVSSSTLCQQCHIMSAVSHYVSSVTLCQQCHIMSAVAHYVSSVTLCQQYHIIH